MVVLTVQVEQGPLLDKLVGSRLLKHVQKRKKHIHLSGLKSFLRSRGLCQIISKQVTLNSRTVLVMIAPVASGGQEVS